ncbi:hypothetical protein LTR95_006374 [Oleoguttula sp. CCFEE 5521]
MAVSVLQMMLAITPATLDQASSLLERTDPVSPIEYPPIPCRTTSSIAATGPERAARDIMREKVSEPVANVQPAFDLAAIARTMRLAEIHRRRRTQAEIAFRDLQIVVTKATRLTTAARHVQRTLTDCLRAEDKYSFARLNNGYADVCKKLTSTPKRSYLAESWSGSQQRLETGNAGLGFLVELSPTSQAQVIEILTNLRYDGGFIAKRLGNLTSKQLSVLLPDGGTSRSSGSIFGGLSRASTRSKQPLGYLVDHLLDDISTSRYRTPLETLVHIHVPVAHDSPGSAAHLRVWAETCAILIQDRRLAGARLLPSLLDIWASHVPWTGKEKLCSWLLRTLRRGHFLLEPNRPSFSARVHGQPEVDAAARAEVFYTECVAELLDVLGDKTGSSAIPDGAMMLCHAVYDALHLSPANQNGLASFVLTRWLFASFLPDLLVSPESHGLLIDHHISDLARQRIFSEIALRAQKTVSDVYHDRPFAQPAVPEMRTLTLRLAAQLETAALPTLDRTATSRTVEESSGYTFVNISAPDALTVMKVLYPPSDTANTTTDPSEIRSSASSVSGFSLFRATDFTEQQWTATPYNLPGAEYFTTLFSAPNMEQPASPVPPADVTDVLAFRRARDELANLVTSTDASADGTWSLLIAQDDERRLDNHDTRMLDSMFGLRNESLENQESGLLQVDASVSAYSAVTMLLRQWKAITPHPSASGKDCWARSPDLLSSVLDQVDAQRGDCELGFDFAGAHRWTQIGEAFESHQDADGSTALSDHITAIASDARRNIDSSLADIRQYELWETAYHALLPATYDCMIVPTKLCAQLRTKMWYYADVRTTGVYDNLRSVASALRTLHNAQRCTRSEGPESRSARSARSVASSSLAASAGQWKSENLVLDLLGVTAAHGGPNKLNDVQVKQVQAWRKRNGVHFVCVGEERLHKFCMEIQKCVDHFTTIGTLEDTMQYRTNRASSQQQSSLHLTKADASPVPHASLRHRMDSLVLQTHIAPSIDSVSSASHTLSNASSREYFDSRSPTLTSKSSATFWSPTLSEAHSPSSTTSLGSCAPAARAEEVHSKGADDTADLLSLRKGFTALLLSEIGDVLFGQGSETDQAFWTGVGGELTEKHLCYARANFEEGDETSNLGRMHLQRSRRRPFDYYAAFRQLFMLFANADDPYSKLEYLAKVQDLIPSFIALSTQRQDLNVELAEAPVLPTGASLPLPEHGSGGDASIDGLYHLFADRTIRPPHIFRDLQYIASLLPSSILDAQPEGKAFWNAVAAVTRIKKEMCRIYIETADKIIDFHTNARGHSRSSSQAQQQRDEASFASPSRTPPLESTTQYTMSDAAHLLQIAAKEGSPVAQRELATLYLTHPDLMDKVLAPWALPKEVFRGDIEGRSRRERDTERYDPGTMCVAIHWMVKAAEGGDALAKAHLRQREEMEKLG